MIKKRCLSPKYVLSKMRNSFRHPKHYVGRLACILLNYCIENYGRAMNDRHNRNNYLKQLKRNILKCPHKDIGTNGILMLQKWELNYARFIIFKKNDLRNNRLCTKKITVKYRTKNDKTSVNSRNDIKWKQLTFEKLKNYRKNTKKYSLREKMNITLSNK